MNKSKMKIISISIAFSLFLFQSTVTKATTLTVNQLYSNAYNATKTALSSKTQKSINAARTALKALKGTSANWAIGEFSKQVDSVQQTIFTKFYKALASAQKNPTQNNIDIARAAIDLNLPSAYKNAFSSAVDKVQQPLISNLTLLYNTAISTGTDVDTYSFANLLLQMENSPTISISKWAKSVKQEYKDNAPGSDSYINSNSKKDYVKMTFLNNTTINIEGSTSGEFTDFQAYSEDDRGYVGSIESNIKVSSDGKFSGTIHIRDNYQNITIGLLNLNKWPGAGSNIFYCINVPFQVKDGKRLFKTPTAYIDNVITDIKLRNEDINKYTGTTSNLTQSQLAELTQLANTIVSGATSDYDKLLKIHDWVANNIYYDNDSIHNGVETDNSAYAVYKSRKAIPEGYTNLTGELIRIVGIPCKNIVGTVLNTNVGTVDNPNYGTRDDWWNAAYVDGRWVILNTTWDSNHTVTKGVFENGAVSYRYFDPTLKAFSVSRRGNP